MSFFEQFQFLHLVKTGLSLRERLERGVAAAYHNAVIARLQRFRENLEHEVWPEPWTVLEAPMALLLSDVCEALGLDEQERASVLGVEGVLALADALEERVRPIPSPRIPMNERQAKALRYVREHGMLDLRTYREICPFWSDETLRLDLADLVARGLLTKNGQNRGTCYVLAS